MERVVVALMALAGLLPAAGGQAESDPSVTCRLLDDPGERTYRLAVHPAGSEPVWTLSMREGEGPWIHLSLPRARPVFDEDGRASLAYRNANGGRQIELDVTPDGARLDVYVDYGLDVNIEPDLDPKVDEMNTDGPVTALECRIARP